MAKAIRPALLLVLAAAIAATLLLTGIVGGATPTPAGAAQGQQTQNQAGNQDAPDTKSGEGETAAGNENEGAKEPAGDAKTESGDRESAGENENEGANEPAGESQPGHEDLDGKQVDHQCPPDCAPGEQP